MRKPLCVTFALIAAFLCHAVAFSDDVDPSGPGLYFPPVDGDWAAVRPQDVGWDGEALEQALDYAAKNRSTGVVILLRGKILAERHGGLEGVASQRFRQRSRPQRGNAHASEDVASAQKSVVSILVGIAQHKGLLSIDDPVTEYLGQGWSKANAEQEKRILIRHLITMTSGLADDGSYQAEPGTKWRYNTPVYAKTMDVLEKASGMDRNQLTEQWLTGRIGMSDSSWQKRGRPGLQSINAYGLVTTARDLARFGLMMLAEGTWDGETIVEDRDYFADAIQTSQQSNDRYGYLWWLNRPTGRVGAESTTKTAPPDMFAAKGALNRRCFVVPSMQLVVTRIGDQPPARGGTFDEELWRLISKAAPKGSR